MFCIQSKNSSTLHFEIFFLSFFNILCKLSPKDTICTEQQSLFSREKKKKNCIWDIKACFFFFFFYFIFFFWGGRGPGAGGGGEYKKKKYYQFVLCWIIWECRKSWNEFHLANIGACFGSLHVLGALVLLQTSLWSPLCHKINIYHNVAFLKGMPFV